MSEVSIEIGKRVRNFRKMRKMTLEELAKNICKTKATVSKYERGEIVLDIETMYDISKVLEVHVEQLLYCSPERTAISVNDINPAFFKGLSRFYAYNFDGRNNKISRCIFDVLSELEGNKYKVMMYMNCLNFENYQNCENTYYGYIEHYDAVSNIQLTNRDTPMEKASLQVLASYLDSDIKWGLWNGFSSRPMMPCASKMLLSKSPLKEDEELKRDLRISREDIKLLKMFNMLVVT